LFKCILNLGPRAVNMLRALRYLNPALAALTHFTLHLLSDSRVSDSSPLAYLRERTCELDTGAFLHCKDSKICFVGLAYGIVKAGE